MKNIIRMLLSVITASGIFLLLFLLLKWNVIVSAVLSVGVYAGLYLVLKPQRKLGGIDVESLHGGEEMQRLLDDARNDLDKMQGNTSKIKNCSVQSDAYALCDTGERIYVYLNEHPEKISLAKRFFTYYLDTAVSILSRYVEFQKTGLNTDEINEVMKKTSDSLPVLNKAFERQFTHLMEGELMNVETDIELLESTLKMEDDK